MLSKYGIERYSDNKYRGCSKPVEKSIVERISDLFSTSYVIVHLAIVEILKGFLSLKCAKLMYLMMR